MHGGFSRIFSFSLRVCKILMELGVDFGVRGFLTISVFLEKGGKRCD